MSDTTPGREEPIAEPNIVSADAAKLRVFISYAFGDLAFVNGLVANLETAGIEPLIDRRDLPYGEKWKPELLDLVRSADAVVFVASPRSIASRWCRWEVEQARAESKRLVPILLEAVPFPELPTTIADIHMLPFTDAWNDDERSATFLKRVELLVDTLFTDHEWTKEHTRLGQLARRWKDRETNDATRTEPLLLRGGALAEAELWISDRPRRAPEPSDLHREFLKASRAAEQLRAKIDRAQIVRTSRLQRRASWALGGVGALVLLAGAAAVATYRETSIQRSYVFASKAREAANNGNLALALRYAVSGLPSPGSLPLDYWSSDLETLLGTLAARYTPMLKEITDIETRGVFNVRVDSSSYRSLVSGSNQGILWDTHDGRIIRRFPLTPGAAPWALFAAAASNRVIFVSGGTLRIVDSDSGNDLASHDVRGFQIQTDRDRMRILATRAVPSNNIAPLPQGRTFSMETGTELLILDFGSSAGLTSIISPDGTRAALKTAEGKAFIFKLDTGVLLFSHIDPRLPVRSIEVSPTGNAILMMFHSGKKYSATLFDIGSGRKIWHVADMASNHDDKYYLSDDGEFLYRVVPFGFRSKTPQIQVWRNGTEVRELKRSTCVHAAVTQLQTSESYRVIFGCTDTEFIDPKSRTVMKLSHQTYRPEAVKSPVFDRVLLDHFNEYRLYDSFNGRMITNEPISSIRPEFSPDGAYLYGQVSPRGSTGSTQARLWDPRTGQVMGVLSVAREPAGARGEVPAEWAGFSSKGTWLVTKHKNAIVLHDGKTGREVSKVLADPGGQPELRSVYFAGPNEDRLVTAHQDGSLRLWDISWRTSEGRSLVESVCRQKLLGVEQRFTPTEMNDPILLGQEEMLTPCLRVGPLSPTWWFERFRWLTASL